MTLSIVGILALALGIGLLFHWLYPLVNLTSELMGLFVFVAVTLKLLLGKLWSLRQKPSAPVGAEKGAQAGAKTGAETGAETGK